MSRVTFYKENALNIAIVAGLYYIIANVLVGFFLGAVQDKLALEFTALGAAAQEQITSQGQPISTFIVAVIPGAAPWILITVAVVAAIATISIVTLAPTLERAHKLEKKGWKQKAIDAGKAALWFVLAIVISRIIYLIIRLILIGATTRNPQLVAVRGVLDVVFFSFVLAAFIAILAKAMHDYSWKITGKNIGICLLVILIFSGLVAVLPLFHAIETGAALALLTALTIEITRPQNTNV